MPARLQKPCILWVNENKGYLGSSGPDKEEKKLHILTHTAHAASQVGVELVLILVIGPHGAPVSCWPHLRRGDLKEPLGSGPGTLCHSSKKAEVHRDGQPKGRVMNRKREQRSGSAHNFLLTSFFPWGQRASSSLGHFQNLGPGPQADSTPKTAPAVCLQATQTAEVECPKVRKSSQGIRWVSCTYRSWSLGYPPFSDSSF